jgi:SAM-dependent methyltransferase
VNSTKPNRIDGQELASKRELFALWRNERSEPEPFYSKLATRAVAEFHYPVAGKQILDLGSGPGYYSRALRSAGATVAAIDLGESDVATALANGTPALLADAARLPFPDASFDGVFCSNMLEHVPAPFEVINEIERVLQPGGWGWISWTNWYSPWGGHDITPFHFLGPKLGTKIHTKLKGPPERNPVFEALWPTYIGRTIKHVQSRPGLTLVNAEPRYYPSQRWVMKVPGLREVVSWNCVLTIEKRN